MRITFIGGGNMATALIGGLVRQGHAPAQLQVVEPAEDARQRLNSLGVRAVAQPDAAALECDVLLLAVKPQQMQAALAPLAGALSTQIVVSIAAGTRLDAIATGLSGYRRLVRAMPNTPALIGEGVTGLYADTTLTAAERAQAERVLAAAGSTVWVQDEAMMDAITAISGSGPAYVFFFIESLEAGARALGFDADTARALALQTFRGAALLAAQSEDAPALLRERVTSKGGTTEAALKSMAADDVAGAITRATRAALERGRELGAKS